jgi:hypothetical protein
LVKRAGYVDALMLEFTVNPGAGLVDPAWVLPRELDCPICHSDLATDETQELGLLRDHIARRPALAR